VRRLRRIGLAGHTPWWPPSTPLFLQLDSARDAADLMAGITGAVATGHISPGEAACGSRECDRWLSHRRSVASLAAILVVVGIILWARGDYGPGDCKPGSVALLTSCNEAAAP
jgi:hypothetical protein